MSKIGLLRKRVRPMVDDAKIIFRAFVDGYKRGRSEAFFEEVFRLLAAEIARSQSNEASKRRGGRDLHD